MKQNKKLHPFVKDEIFSNIISGFGENVEDQRLPQWKNPGYEPLSSSGLLPILDFGSFFVFFH